MAFAGFAVFGAFWGAWGASIPAIRDQAGVTDGQLGTALLFIGAGALPAMPLSGRAVDRWGLRATAVLLALLGGSGVLVAVAARDFVTLALGLALVGAASGAADVAINTAAGSAQRASSSPVVTRAHATFAAAVVVTSLLTGALRGLDAPVATPFVVVAVAAIAVAVALGAANARVVAAPSPVAGDVRSRPALPLAPLLVLGGLGALAFAVENAHQSWSAVYLGDVLSARPAVFAAVVALARFAVATLESANTHRRPDHRRHDCRGRHHRVRHRWVRPIALTGLGLAAAGTAVLHALVALARRWRGQLRVASRPSWTKPAGRAA